MKDCRRKANQGSFQCNMKKIRKVVCGKPRAVSQAGKKLAIAIAPQTAPYIASYEFAKELVC